jgi:hypothetical protein
MRTDPKREKVSEKSSYSERWRTTANVKLAADAVTVEPVSGLQHPQELGKIMGKRTLPLEYKVHPGLPRP